MPAGPGPMSFLYLAGAKAIGYTRTAIGIAVGLLYGGIWIIVIDRFATGSSGRPRGNSLFHPLDSHPLRRMVACNLDIF
jgi:hypothetical protein